MGFPKVQKKFKKNSNFGKKNSVKKITKSKILGKKTYLVGPEVLEDVFGYVGNHLGIVGVAAVDFVEDIVFQLHAGVVQDVFRRIVLLVDPFDLHVVLLLN